MKKLLAHRSPTATETGSPAAIFTLPALLAFPTTAHEKIQMSPRQLLKAAIPHLDAQDRVDLLAALGITFDAGTGEVIMQTPNGPKRLLPGDPA